MSKIRSIFTIVLLALTLQSCFALKLFNKKSEISKPYLDTDLEEDNYKASKFKNILGYKNDEYVLVYGNDKVWLFDMLGKKYREWNTNIKRTQLLKNCNLMVIDNNQNDEIAEKNQNGDIVWEYKVPGMTHHDFEITDDGHITFFYRKTIPEEFELKNNCRHDEVLTDVILEVDRDGNKYFEWNFYEHYGKIINQDLCTESRRRYLAKSKYSKQLDTIHPNGLDVLQDNKWYRKGYKEFKPGNILVTPHHLKKIFIIDKETSRVVWIYDGRQDGVTLDGPHEAKMIGEGLPGAGNIMIFDNGLHERKYTIVREINPITKKTVWSYSKPGVFFSKYAGSHQRLKNGDTFISDDGSARAFIVDKNGKTKWQFINPHMKDPWVKRARLYPKKEFAHCLTES